MAENFAESLVLYLITQISLLGHVVNLFVKGYGIELVALDPVQGLVPDGPVEIGLQSISKFQLVALLPNIDKHILNHLTGIFYREQHR